jgi:hypothetical protein
MSGAYIGFSIDTIITIFVDRSTNRNAGAGIGIPRADWVWAYRAVMYPEDTREPWLGTTKGLLRLRGRGKHDAASTRQFQRHTH